MLHVRGSRHDELAYSFESVNIRSSVTGLPFFNLIPEALEELSLQSSPDVRYNAPAVFLHKLRSAGTRLRATVYGETDRFTSDHESRFRTFSYGYRNLLFIIDGALLKNKIGFFLAAEHEHFGDHYRKF